MFAPSRRLGPVVSESISHGSVAAARVGRAWLVFLLAWGLQACQSGGSPGHPDAKGRETGRADGSDLDMDLTGSDVGQETTSPEDGRLTDGAAFGDLTIPGPVDSAGDTTTGNDLRPRLDLAQPDLGRAPTVDAEIDAPADVREEDLGKADTEPASVDSGPSAHGSDAREAPDARDADASDGRDGAPPVIADGAFDSAADPDASDAPVDRPDAAIDARGDVRDASIIGDDASGQGDADDDCGDDGGGPCCGCLCRDPSWSCSHDTCVDPTGHALTLAAEAGFFELAGGSYVSESQTRTSPTHRIWYAFHPAASAPESKPLAVFFNGGPGSATTVYLFALNTAPFTLDPAFTGTAKIAANPNSWAQFANLLYVDAPGSGFSYPVALAGGSKPRVGIDLDRDAGNVLRVVIRFLARHPRLQANPVIIVGESYGGTRSTLMLDHLMTYQTLAGTTAAYRDLDLYNDLIAHFAAVWPQDNPRALSAAKIATQFGRQVLIQPVVAGDAQWGRQTHDTSVCLASGYDSYQCDQPSGWSDQVATTAAQNLTTIATLRQALGVDPTTIDWLYASARKTAYGRTSGTVVSTPEMTATFGALTSEDNYLLSWNSAIASSYDGTARGWGDSAIGMNFLADLVYVSTFITNAKYDMVVSTPAIAPALASYTSTVASAVIDTTARAGIDRPGWIKVTYAPGAIPAPTTREIRFPSYGNAGHTASIRDPAHLLADVMQWYATMPPASSPAYAGRPVEGTSMLSTVTPPASAQQPVPLYIGP